MGRLSTLTTGELATTITACDWLVSQSPKLNLLDPVTAAKVSTLGADCRAETEHRATAARESRRDAVAARTDPMQHYSA